MITVLQWCCLGLSWFFNRIMGFEVAAAFPGYADRRWQTSGEQKSMVGHLFTLPCSASSTSLFLPLFVPQFSHILSLRLSGF